MTTQEMLGKSLLASQPEFVRLKELIDAEALGTIGTIRVGVCLSTEDGDDSAALFAAAGAAAVDAVSWAFGDLDRLGGMENNPGKQSDGSYGVFAGRLKSGAIVHLEISTVEGPGENYFYYEVAGSKGLFDYDSRREPELVLVARQRDNTTPAASGKGDQLRKNLKVAARLGMPSTGATLFEVARKSGVPA